jgi:hypothetical protein
MFLLGTVAHACNPSYSGGGDQKDHGSKSALANSLQDSIRKKQTTTNQPHWRLRGLHVFIPEVVG